jgi:hypothetical protein
VIELTLENRCRSSTRGRACHRTWLHPATLRVLDRAWALVGMYGTKHLVSTSPLPLSLTRVLAKSAKKPSSRRQDRLLGACELQC